MTDLRKIDRGWQPIEADQLKTATKQDWYVMYYILKVTLGDGS